MGAHTTLAAGLTCVRFFGAVTLMALLEVVCLAARVARQRWIFGITVGAVAELVVVRILGALNRVVVVFSSVGVLPLAAAVITPFALVDDPRDRDHVALALELFLVGALVIGHELAADRGTSVAVVVTDEEARVTLAVFVGRFTKHCGHP